MENIESKGFNPRERFEELHRMILETRAEIAQVKEDSLEKPERARELIPLKETLESLEAERAELEKK